MGKPRHDRRATVELEVPHTLIRSRRDMPEADLYQPIKRFLEAQGYEVKGEVGACDVVALREGAGPVVVEIKERLTLALILQAVDRLSVSDTVYVAFRAGRGHSATWRTKRKQVLGLLRRLGVGLLTVSTRGQVKPVLDPAGYRPRTNRRRQTRLLREFAERVGDPETGGSASSQHTLTSYRQDAIRCAGALSGAGVLEARPATGTHRSGTGREHPEGQPLRLVRAGTRGSLRAVSPGNP